MLRTTPPALRVSRVIPRRRESPGNPYFQRNEEPYQWDTMVRDVVDLAKMGIRNYSTVIGNWARTGNNHFILPIFTHINPCIQLFEIVRRGVHPILLSLRTSSPVDRFNRALDDELMRESIESIMHTFCLNLTLLYRQTSHTKLRPDELEFLESTGVHQPLHCQCRQCKLNRMWVRPSRVRRSLFSPRPALPSELGITPGRPTEVTPRPNRTAALETPSSVDSTEQLFREMENQSEDPTEEARLMSQVTATLSNPGPNGTPMLQVHIPHLDGFMAISFPMDDLATVLTEEDPAFLAPVTVTASIDEYVNAVDSVWSADEHNEDCPICLQKMENSLDLNSIVIQTKCCGKLFHDRCLREHICRVGPPKCPLCRHDLREFTERSDDDI
jgi:hypothetical protein